MSISLVVLPAILAFPDSNSPRRARLVADTDRAILQGGFQMLVDRSLSTPTPTPR